ncbi:DUF2500 domain-containing protein [Entomohabitans teleogrylli]|uniref:DUF2500 domain-containing protein n=1 Tax=Entomohabitans teleogrylli TaxID=1384589 RepID=UPI00073DA9EC|nr:DUF2500 domain-containing protein [Entomohabitans teleogrylli]
MSKPPLIFVIVVAVIVVAASFRFVQQRRQNAENDAAPLVHKRVVVAGKRERPAVDRRSRQREVTSPEDAMRYEVSFHPQSGGLDSTFRVTASQYHQITVGEQGILSSKGTRFVSFAADAPQ